jgi:hypothetical protein
MTCVSQWLEGKRQKPSDGALRIADAMGISDLEATSRHTAPRPAAPRRAGRSQQPPSFAAMVIAEWHKLVADLSRAFARKRIHRAATRCRQTGALVMPLDTPKQKRPD